MQEHVLFLGKRDISVLFRVSHGPQYIDQEAEAEERGEEEECPDNKPNCAALACIHKGTTRERDPRDEEEEGDDDK